jgi:hypothetical protein
MSKPTSTYYSDPEEFLFSSSSSNCSSDSCDSECERQIRRERNPYIYDDSIPLPPLELPPSLSSSFLQALEKGDKMTGRGMTNPKAIECSPTIAAKKPVQKIKVKKEKVRKEPQEIKVVKERKAPKAPSKQNVRFQKLEASLYRPYIKEFGFKGLLSKYPGAVLQKASPKLLAQLEKYWTEA